MTKYVHFFFNTHYIKEKIHLFSFEIDSCIIGLIKILVTLLYDDEQCRLKMLYTVEQNLEVEYY